MPEFQQRYPGGPWEPAEPMPWAQGLDWEVATQPDGSYVACLYDQAHLIATLTGRNRVWLSVRMWWRRRRVLSRRGQQ